VLGRHNIKERLQGMYAQLSNLNQPQLALRGFAVAMMMAIHQVARRDHAVIWKPALYDPITKAEKQEQP
jgi:hypothetical protein